MRLCTTCRLPIRRLLPQARYLSTETPSPAEILAKPLWSVRSLLSSPSNDAAKDDKITPKQLHHLLKLSALPLPKTPEEEHSMIATLQSQLHFVRAVQRVDTKGVKPLHAIRDETDQGTQEETITLDKMKGLLEEEMQVGYYKRPKRVKTKVESEAEDWDALATASRRKGRFFVVQGRKAGEAA